MHSRSLGNFFRNKLLAEVSTPWRNTRRSAILNQGQLCTEESAVGQVSATGLGCMGS